MRMCLFLPKLSGTQVASFSALFDSIKFFHIFSQTARSSGEKGIELKIWFSLQFLPETFLILRRIQRDIIKVRKSSCKVPVILVTFYSNLNSVKRI